ncbi:hypothetical protein GO986_02900 [Deinococcus sp. HMF7620]|uniref:Uncharacterized protein n=1 Tax=Deinococcus arboris TaxID=2682977 RepID=A0A7C9HQ26_9DEIO|nr:hypothetical protein [Deinococcus arboris]MVN85707.1 hypothetical protein [Deinococcus arboris]
MRLLAGLILLGTLSACSPREPVMVPTDARVLHGTFEGTAKPGNAQTTEPLRLETTATYKNQETYEISGTLTFRNEQYVVKGEGQANEAHAFKPQTTRRIFPTWTLQLLQGGIYKGRMSGLFSGSSQPQRHGGYIAWAEEEKAEDYSSVEFTRVTAQP